MQIEFEQMWLSPASEPAAYRENRLDLVSAHPSEPSQVLQGGSSYCIGLEGKRFLHKEIMLPCGGGVDGRG